jgi:hypothetical protein
MNRDDAIFKFKTEHILEIHGQGTAGCILALCDMYDQELIAMYDGEDGHRLAEQVRGELRLVRHELSGLPPSVPLGRDRQAVVNAAMNRIIAACKGQSKPN